MYNYTWEAHATHCRDTQTLAGLGQLDTSCSPLVDAVPDSAVFIGDLCDPPGVIGGILMQKTSRQLIEPCHGCLASTQVLQEGLKK